MISNAAFSHPSLLNELTSDAFYLVGGNEQWNCLDKHSMFAQSVVRFIHAAVDNIDLFLIAFIFLGIISNGNHSNVVN